MKNDMLAFLVYAEFGFFYLVNLQSNTVKNQIWDRIPELWCGTEPGPLFRCTPQLGEGVWMGQWSWEQCHQETRLHYEPRHLEGLSKVEWAQPRQLHQQKRMDSSNVGGCGKYWAAVIPECDTGRRGNGSDTQASYSSYLCRWHHLTGRTQQWLETCGNW